MSVPCGYRDIPNTNKIQIDNSTRSLWVQGYTVKRGEKLNKYEEFPVGTGIYLGGAPVTVWRERVPCRYRDIPHVHIQEYGGITSSL